MKQEQKKNNKKKRTILLATLIPLGAAAVATAVAVPLVLNKTQVVEKIVPFTSDFFKIDESELASGTVYVKGFSDAVSEDLSLLKDYTTLKFGNYKTATKIIFTGDEAIYTLTKHTPKLTSVIFENDENCSIELKANAFKINDGSITTMDFGTGSVTLFGLACWKANSEENQGSLTKVILSKNTKLDCYSNAQNDYEPFQSQHRLSTIDVSRITSQDDIENVVSWKNGQTKTDVKVWNNSTSYGRSKTGGKIIIANSSLETAWKTKFKTAGLDLDTETGWTFEVKQ